MMNFIGKYICYGHSHGGFCLGKIESESRVNTVDGFKEVFIVTNMVIGPIPIGSKRAIVHKSAIDLEKDIKKIKKKLKE
jgi:hypothetical protein